MSSSSTPFAIPAVPKRETGSALQEGERAGDGDGDLPMAQPDGEQGGGGEGGAAAGAAGQSLEGCEGGASGVPSLRFNHHPDHHPKGEVRDDTQTDRSSGRSSTGGGAGSTGGEEVGVPSSEGECRTPLVSDDDGGGGASPIDHGSQGLAGGGGWGETSCDGHSDDHAGGLANGSGASADVACAEEAEEEAEEYAEDTAVEQTGAETDRGGGERQEGSATAGGPRPTE